MCTSLPIIVALLAVCVSIHVSASELQQAVYLGTNIVKRKTTVLPNCIKGQTRGQANLSHFCAASQGIDIIPLAFLS